MLGVPLPLDRTTSLSALLLNDTVKEQKLQEEVPLMTVMKLPVATSRSMFPMFSPHPRSRASKRVGQKHEKRYSVWCLPWRKSVPRKRICSKNSGPFFQKAFAIIDYDTYHISCARSTGRLFALCAGRSRQTDT